jgi:hypothetical protein
MKSLLCSIAFIVPFCLASQDVSFTDASVLLTTGTVSDHAIAVVDMNGDGKDDIVRMSMLNSGPGGAEQEVLLAIQQGPGEDFVEQSIGEMSVSGSGSAGTWGLCVADLDRNGINDLITGGFYNGIYLFKANESASTFTSENELDGDIFVQGMSAFDIDNNGSIDVFICDDNDISQILTNDGYGNMSEVSSGLVPETDSPSDNSGNYGSVFVDVDNNGHADLYLSKCRQGVTNDTDPRRINQLFMNNGDGTWTSDGESRGVDIGAQSWASDFGDYDNDGDFDLFVGNHDVLSNFLVNDGTGHFTDMTAEAGLVIDSMLIIQCSWADFNNDGFIDLITMGAGAASNGYTARIGLNDGQGSFTMINDPFGDYPTNSYAIGDLNNDGSLDLYITANGYGGWGNDSWEDRIFLNNGSINNWMKVSLTGVESNLNGIGARVSIYGPWGVQIREIKAGESYGIQNSLTQHFGLGEYDVIDEVVVTWPSGAVDVFTDVNANQTLSIVEGSGTVSIDESIRTLGISAYPNPAVDVAYIEIQQFESLTAESIELRVYDMHGKVVEIQKITSELSSVDMTEYAPGIYSYSISHDGKLIAVDELIKE